MTPAATAPEPKAGVEPHGPVQDTMFRALGVLRFVVLLNTIRSFQIFIEVFVLTRGGPLESTLTLVYHLYERAFYHFEMGYASALAYLLLLLVGVILLLQRRVLGGDSMEARAR